jgi:hypothetical protein
MVPGGPLGTVDALQADARHRRRWGIADAR